MIENEHSLIGLTLYDNAALDAAGAVRPEHFHEPTHQRIWETILERVKAGVMAEPVSVADRMAGDRALEALGGIRYLAELIDHAPPVTMAEHYAGRVIDGATKRALADVGARLQQVANASGDTGEELLSQVEAEIAEIARAGGQKNLAEPAGLTALDTLERAWNGELRGSPTGVACLDRVTNGVRPGDVWVVGGRSSMGKSVVALSLARGIAEQGRGVLVFSLEMPMREVQCRLIADLAHDREAAYDGLENIGYGELLKGRGLPFQKDRARAAAKRLAELPISVIDLGGLTIMDIRTQAQRQLRAWEKARVPVGAVVIDHLGLVRAHGKPRDSKAAETADTVNELKAIAKALKAPLICLAQVNRGPEQRENKRPSMADLNWSGSIEQIADFVCLLYREAYYLERSPDPDDAERAGAVEHELELIVAKNRSGPICTVKAWVDVASNALRDREQDDRRRA